MVCDVSWRRAVLEARLPRSAAAIRWVTVAGGLPPGVDVADRESMYERSSMERRAQ